MTDANQDFENFTNFVQQRIAAITHAKDADSRESTLQGVSVRLTAGNVALIDHFAKELDYNRQQFMAHLINLALDQMMGAWVEGMKKDEAAKAYRALQDIRAEG